MHIPYVLTNLGKIETTSDIHGGIHTFSHNMSAATQAICFAVSVPAQEFHFSPTPHLYMQKEKSGL